jgi:hypothetical protein
MNFNYRNRRSRRGVIHHALCARRAPGRFETRPYGMMAWSVSVEKIHDHTL